MKGKRLSGFEEVDITVAGATIRRLVAMGRRFFSCTDILVRDVA
jgi:hypothetical protein